MQKNDQKMHKDGQFDNSSATKTKLNKTTTNEFDRKNKKVGGTKSYRFTSHIPKTKNRMKFLPFRNSINKSTDVAVHHDNELFKSVPVDSEQYYLGLLAKLQSQIFRVKNNFNDIQNYLKPTSEIMKGYSGTMKTETEGGLNVVKVYNVPSMYEDSIMRGDHSIVVRESKISYDDHTEPSKFDEVLQSAKTAMILGAQNIGPRVYDVNLICKEKVSKIQSEQTNTPQVFVILQYVMSGYNLSGSDFVKANLYDSDALEAFGKALFILIDRLSKLGIVCLDVKLKNCVIDTIDKDVLVEYINKKPQDIHEIVRLIDFDAEHCFTIDELFKKSDNKINRLLSSLKISKSITEKGNEFRQISRDLMLALLSLHFRRFLSRQPGTKRPLDDILNNILFTKRNSLTSVALIIKQLIDSTPVVRKIIGEYFPGLILLESHRNNLQMSLNLTEKKKPIPQINVYMFLEEAAGRHNSKKNIWEEIPRHLDNAVGTRKQAFRVMRNRFHMNAKNIGNKDVVNGTSHQKDMSKSTTEIPTLDDDRNISSNKENSNIFHPQMADNYSHDEVPTQMDM